MQNVPKIFLFSNVSLCTFAKRRCCMLSWMLLHIYQLGDENPQSLVFLYFKSGSSFQWFRLPVNFTWIYLHLETLFLWFFGGCECCNWKNNGLFIVEVWIRSVISPWRTCRGSPKAIFLVRSITLAVSSVNNEILIKKQTI